MVWCIVYTDSSCNVGLTNKLVATHDNFSTDRNGILEFILKNRLISSKPSSVHIFSFADDTNPIHK